MKQSDIRRTGDSLTGLLAGLALTLIVPAAHAGLFTGVFDTNNWAQVASSNPGGFAFTGSGDSVSMVLTGSGISGVDSFTDVGLNWPSSSTNALLSFSWTLKANGNYREPSAYLFVYTGGGNYDQYNLVYPNGSLTGITVIPDPDYTPVLVELVANLESVGKSPAQLEIMPVPEPANLLGAMMAVMAGCRWFLRRHKAGT
jgi:hypothetical protein